jgi:hypothetical protein
VLLLASDRIVQNQICIAHPIEGEQQWLQERGSVAQDVVLIGPASVLASVPVSIGVDGPAWQAACCIPTTCLERPCRDSDVTRAGRVSSYQKPCSRSAFAKDNIA